MPEHIRQVLDSYSHEFLEQHKESDQYFFGTLHFFLMELVDAAMKDGVNREWLVIRLLGAAHESVVCGKKRSPELTEVAAEILCREATKLDE